MKTRIMRKWTSFKLILVLFSIENKTLQNFPSELSSKLYTDEENLCLSNRITSDLVFTTLVWILKYLEVVCVCFSLFIFFKLRFLYCNENHVEIDVIYNLCGNEKASSGHSFYYVYLRREHPLDQVEMTLRLLRSKDGSFEMSYLFIASTDVSDAALERKTDLRGRITSSLHPVEPVVEDWKTIVSADISCARISFFGKED
uniref:Uncharacterized protein n=1 Tax=Glossina pallidipes TaxID=7398 RepID=A0A1A9ZJY1_GLOPL